MIWVLESKKPSFVDGRLLSFFLCFGGYHFENLFGVVGVVMEKFQQVFLVVKFSVNQVSSLNFERDLIVLDFGMIHKMPATLKELRPISKLEYQYSRPRDVPNPRRIARSKKRPLTFHRPELSTELSRCQY